MREIIRTLAHRNGYNQDNFVLEEMAELQKELIKHRRGKSNRDEIVEECVDVLLTLYILLDVYDADEAEVTSIIDFKLNRLRDFLPKEKS